MPKINSAGTPSYEGHAGVVTNAVGEQFEVNPSLDLDGKRPEGYVREDVQEFEETPAGGVAGPLVPVDEDNRDPRDPEDPRATTDPAADRDDEDDRDSSMWNPVKPEDDEPSNEPDNQGPAFDGDKKSATERKAPNSAKANTAAAKNDAVPSKAGSDKK